MNKRGTSITEVVVVIAIIVVLVSLCVVNAKAIQTAITGNGSTAEINSLLKLARATALSRHTYAGVRFQKQDNIQYATLIIKDQSAPYPDDDKSIPFVALENYQPYKPQVDVNDAIVLFNSQGKLTQKWVALPSENSKLSDNFLSINSKAFFVNSYLGELVIP